MKKKIFLLCNAHLDPVWLWRWNEGAAEAVSTFRVAADFCERYDGFIFNHNEALLYEWVERYEPELFKRIQKLVAAGKWHIMGGWYLQPDCLMPCGESIIRQIETGKRYFKEKFGVEPKTAVNVDSFGHSRGLVQIMKKSGYASYIFMRPERQALGNFVWQGFDGSEIVCSQINGGYNTLKGDGLNKIKWCIEKVEGDALLVTWGIGNHGGGPSEVDLNDINKFIEEENEYETVHSDSEAFFKALDKEVLEKRNTSLVNVNVGCYTTMSQIKQLHRAVEINLGMCEKMLVHSGIDFDRRELERAEKAMLFCEFHDILPGTMIKKGEDDTICKLGYAKEITERLKTEAFFKLCEGQKKARDGEIPVLVYNPHPYEIEAEVEVEFQLQNQNWNDGEYTVARVYNEDRELVLSQHEKEDCTFSLDWRKKVVFKAKLKPMCINRFDCVLEVKDGVDMPIEVCEENGFSETDEHITVKTDALSVKISKKTGLIDEYICDGKNLLKASAGRLRVYSDNEDPWAMRVDGIKESCGEFALMTKEEANSFRGYECSSFDSVGVIENGDLRIKIEALFKYDKSFAVVTYTVPKSGKYVDTDIRLYMNNVCKAVKYELLTNAENGEFIGQTMFGKEGLRKDGNEAVFQKWCGLYDGKNDITVINGGTYGGSAEDGELYLNLLRTPVYSAHPIKERELAPKNRFLNHIDMGERHFDFRIMPSCENIDYEALIYNEKPYVLSFFPSGSENVSQRKSGSVLELGNKAIILSAFKKTADGKLLIRLYNSSDKAETAEIKGMDFCLKADFCEYEVKTFVFDGDRIKESDMLGRIK